jgi:flagellar FliJ protein
MSTLNSLSLAIESIKVKRDQALSFLQKTQLSHSRVLEQMQQLQQYALETEQRWTHSAQQSTTPELLHHHYQFMGRLHQTMALQDGVIETSKVKVDNARQLVLQVEIRLASLQKLVAKRQADLATVQMKREQKQMDEFAALQTQRQIRLKNEEML